MILKDSQGKSMFFTQTANAELCFKIDTNSKAIASVFLRGVDDLGGPGKSRKCWYGSNALKDWCHFRGLSGSLRGGPPSLKDKR
ncbi:unnamed protein product [Arctogadus glacialis]